MSRKKQDKYSPQPGALVFAKVKGYPFWPARVESEGPGGRKVAAGKFPVFFFGTYESAVVLAKDIVPYEENKDRYGKGKKKDFTDGMKEIAETPHITGRPAVQSVTSETISNRNESSEAPVGAEAVSGDAFGGEDKAAAGADQPGAENGLVVDAPLSPPAPPVSSGKKAARKRKSEPAVGSESKNKKRKTSNETSKRSSKKKVEMPLPGQASDAQHAEGQDQEKTSDSEKLSDLERLEKLKAKAVEKEKKKEELKAEKMMRKRQERLKQIKAQPVAVATIRDVEAEVVESLSIEVRDVQRGLQAMSRLDRLAVTPALLCEYPDILVTIRKCRKYVHDELVRRKADYLHHKYKNMFSDPSIDPALLKKMKAIQKKQSSGSEHSNAKTCPVKLTEPRAEEESSSQSQFPADPPSEQSAETPAESSSPVAATSANPLSEPPAGDLSSSAEPNSSVAPGCVTAAAEADKTNGEAVAAELSKQKLEEAAVQDERSEPPDEKADQATIPELESGQEEHLAAAAPEAASVSPVVSAVIENLTGAVAVEVPFPPALPSAGSEEASAASEVPREGSTDHLKADEEVAKHNLIT